MSAEDDVDELIKHFTLAQAELLKGNSEPAKEMCSHRQDVTLAKPLGPVVHGWEQVAAATDQAASQFRDGEYVGVEDVSKCVTPELAYICEDRAGRGQSWRTGDGQPCKSAGNNDHAP